jgi:hypothetical protein
VRIRKRKSGGIIDAASGGSREIALAEFFMENSKNLSCESAAAIKIFTPKNFVRALSREGSV